MRQKTMTDIQSKVSQAVVPNSFLKVRFEDDAISDCVTLSPAQTKKSCEGADAIRLKLEKLGITEADVIDAVKLARLALADDGS
jgi:hypothetical protein